MSIKTTVVFEELLKSDELDKRIEEGYKFIAYSIDTVFLNTISNFKNYA